jgi:large subunit ribosomal protein L6
MGRLGKLPVEIPEKAKAEIKGTEVSVTGPMGSLDRTFSDMVKISDSPEGIFVEAKGNSKSAKQHQGSTRAHIANMIAGVTEGWKKRLEVNGPGYRAEVNGQDLVLTVGYSHPIVITAPEGVKFSIEKNVITVEGADKEAVGHVSALVRRSREPNPYTGSGVKYADEKIRRKVGKQAGKVE